MGGIVLEMLVGLELRRKFDGNGVLEIGNRFELFI